METVISDFKKKEINMASDLNQTPNANRTHIAFFGKINAGKSSVVNAVTQQNMSIVSEYKGTTTDPVSKAMELLPLGSVLIIDTPGIDDNGTLGSLRVKKTKQILNKTDVAVLVVDCSLGMDSFDIELEELFKIKEIPYLIVFNKCDLKSCINSEQTKITDNQIYVSATEKININELKERIAALAKVDKMLPRIIGDKLSPSDVVILVTPIDESAPKGRMILPQVQALRDILDSNAICVVTQTNELTTTLNALKEPPKLVITDSQVFNIVKDIIPDAVPLTSFSILFARVKGILGTAVNGASSITALKYDDKILIAEGCTHHRQCEDIGTVKLPNWIEKFTENKFQFKFVSGGDFPEDLSEFSLVVHCGGCMLGEREVKYRMNCAKDQGIAFTNYGTLIAYINGILARSVAPVLSTKE